MRIWATFAVVIVVALTQPAQARSGCSEAAAICETAAPDAMRLIGGGAVRVVTHHGDQPGVAEAAADLTADLAAVAGSETTIDSDHAVIAGTIGHNPTIDALIASGKIDVSAIRGEWEGYIQQLVDDPAPGIARALVIAGSDRRGTIFGIYDLSRRIGVSPWNWWADVPVRTRAALYVTPGARHEKPGVQYRGIFLNDEEPALGNWARTKFGGINAPFYERVFELILRLKGNYLWPAMWGKSLWDDDPNSAALASRMGIVLGTSHHEPMVRAHVEWERYGKGPWDYTKNAAALRDFWRKGLARNAGRETLVTIGMRGDGDEPMTEGTATELLETIVADQRAIIADVTGKPASETPQVWALYKEVQDYYDQGMRVPDDVLLLFADDNWGNIRRLPQLSKNRPGETRPGGYGVYYHFDYVGGPRNYKWINVTQISRVWEQMKLARAHGADRLWVVNVGDLKPMELPTSFFLDLAWNPEAMTVEAMADYHRAWAAEQFGAGHAEAIGDILQRTTRYLSRRNPELLSPETWSITHDREASRVLADYAALERDALAIEAKLPEDARDAYFHLVLHPVLAAANLNRLYVTVARNRLHAEQGRADTNALADQAKALFARDAELSARYEATAGGKWPHMMDQTKIGYTSWQQPDRDIMPEVRRIAVPEAAGLGVAIENVDGYWTPGRAPLAAPVIERFGCGTAWATLFNRGESAFDYTARTDASWLTIDQPRGRIEDAALVTLGVDWSRAPLGTSSAQLTLTGAGGTLVQPVTVINRPDPGKGAGHIECRGRIAIEAAHFASSEAAGGARWQVIPDLGRTLSAITPFPQAGASFAPGEGPVVEYPIHLNEAGEITVRLVASPSLDTQARGRLRYAVQIDDAPPQVIDLWAGDQDGHWDEAVSDRARIMASRHCVAEPGRHTLRLWAVDRGLVVQRIEIYRGTRAPSTLGRPESERR